MKLLLLLSALFSLTVSILAEDTATENKSTTESKTLAKIAENIKVSSLGCLADFGNLYNASIDDLTNYVSVFNRKSVEYTNIVTTNITSTKIDFVKTETYIEKLEKLGVEPSLLLSILGGLRSFDSSSDKYLTHNKRTANSVKTSLVYSIRTVREELSINSNTSINLINEFMFSNSYVDFKNTHVIVGREWGVDAVLSLEVPNVDPSKAAEVRAKLEAALNAVASLIDNRNEIDSSKFADIEEIGANVDLIGDYSSINGFTTDFFPMSHFITEIRNLRDVMNDVQKNGEEHNGKGKVKKYILMPYPKLLEIFGRKSNSTGVWELDEETSREFLQVFQNIRDVELQLDELLKRMKPKISGFPRSEFKKVKELKKQFTSFKYDWNEDFGDKLVQFRKGAIDHTTLRSLITSYRNSTWTPENINSQLADYRQGN